jgi:60 kDa SS-A/Ro ribonucleoprotein
MQMNQARKIIPVYTAGGAPAYPHLSPLQQLRRSVLACLLWEKEFYEDGETIGDRIATLAAQVKPQELADLAIEARSEQNLRHVPLLLTAELAKHGGAIVAKTLEKVIKRADEVSEFLTVYWRGGKTPIAKQVKKGLAAALSKFDAYSLAKYDREKAIRLRDVLFMVHAKPKDEAQAALWKKLVDGTLESPDTWEVALSGGKDKKETFERLMREGQLGYMALLRNLRNMTDAGVDEGLIRDAILARKGAQRVLPFRYVAAARACPRLEPVIDQALSEAVSDMPALPGKTAVLVDVSGSMDERLSSKSDLTRLDAGAALASLINGNVRVFTFSERVVEVPPRRGMAGVDAIRKSQPHSGTRLAEAVDAINSQVQCDRLIVITDEQSTSYRKTPDPVAPKAYMINVASNKNGVGYGKWTHIDGFSEGVLRWIVESEAPQE